MECMHTQDLEKDDICYDKCTKGKPCHTCIFEDVSLLNWCCDAVPAHGTSWNMLHIIWHSSTLRLTQACPAICETLTSEHPN